MLKEFHISAWLPRQVALFSADIRTRFGGLVSGSTLTVSLALALLCLPQDAASSEDYSPWQGQYRFSAETVELANHEHMGLVGMNYLVDVAPWFTTGIGAYGAMTGQRGGFLTGGIEAGILYPIAPDWRMGAGIFLGGGGGKAALVGGGLMARSHVELLYDAGLFRVGFQYVNLDFPNGSIRNDHAALIVEVPFSAFRFKSGLSRSPSDALADAVRTTAQEPGTVRDFLGPLSAIYHPFTGVKNTDNVALTGQFSLIGFEYGRYVTERSYLLIETAGAMGGGADGYAELFFGGGYRMPLFSGGGCVESCGLELDGRFSIGSGGGGRVDTGGGALSRFSAGLRYSLTERLQIGVSTGIVDAFRGGFRARTIGMDASYRLDFLSFDGARQEADPTQGGVSLLDWRIRLSNQVYRTKDERMRRMQSGQPISLLGVKIDADVAPNYYLTGQAFGAYSGGAGGYGVGLIGPGIRSGRLLGTEARVFVEALVGASGGGGMSVGGGAVIQPAAGVVYDLGDRLSIEASVGKLKALHGDLDTTVYDAGLTYRFSTLYR